MPHCLPDRRDQHRQTFPDGFGVSGEVQDQGFAPGPGGGAGEDGGGDFFKTARPHGFAEAWEFTVKNGAGGFRGVVVGGGACAAGGEDELAVFPIAEGAEEGFDAIAVVGHDVADPLDIGETVFGEDAFDLGAGKILIDPCAGAVTEGEAGDLHCLVFPVTVIPSMDIVLSTALHMS